MAFESLVKRLIGIAMVVGPLLAVIAGMFYMADEVVPAALFGFYGGILMLVAYLWLAWLVGQHSSRLGVVCLVAGLLGGSIFFMAPVEDLTREMLAREGVSEAALDAVIEEVPWQLALIWINGLLFPLSWVLVGIGLLRANAIQRWGAILLIITGFSFVLGVGLELGENATIAGTMAMILVALAPTGWRLMTSDSPALPAGEPTPASS